MIAGAQFLSVLRGYSTFVYTDDKACCLQLAIAFKVVTLRVVCLFVSMTEPPKRSISGDEEDE